MAEPLAGSDPTIVNTPPAAPAPTPESKLFANTSNGDPKAPPPAAPPAPALAATPPPAVPEPPKVPTEPIKPEAPKAPATPPTDYTLVLPENSPLGAEDLAAIAKEAKDAGLPKEKAESLLKTYNQLAVNTQVRVEKQQQDAFQQTKTQWKDAIAKDPEMGGDNYAETVALSSRAFQALASPELQVWADKTGLGNYPEFVRMMAKAGRMMAEDKLVLGQIGGAPANRDPASVLYGKTTPDGTGKKTS